MDLLYSVIVLFLVALIWTGVLFLLFKKIIGHQTKIDKRMLLGGLLLFIALMGIVVAGTVAFEYMESPDFCGTFCHIMEPYHDSYFQPGNNSMMAIHVESETKCSYCHEEPGIIGKIGGLLRAVPEVYLYYTNTYNPNDLGGNVSREICLKCHDDSTATAPSLVTSATGTAANPHDDEKLCTECHNAHYIGLGLNENTCSICHGISFENFEGMLSDHSERAGSDCMECHNREHPDNALISFTEYPELINTDFCSDCHAGDVERLGSEEHESMICTSCHNEHSILSINFDNCLDSCHDPATSHDATTTSCSVCHDTSTIHSEPGVDLGELFLNVDCAKCHSAENSSYESSFSPESLEIYGDNGCIDCHSDHKAISYPHLIDSPFEDCDSCHSTYNTETTIHDRSAVSYQNFLEITKEFCSDCHTQEFTRFSRELHNSMECIDCHEEHNTLHVNYDKCIDCHETPSDHNILLTSCSDSGCHDDLRSIHSVT